MNPFVHQKADSALCTPSALLMQSQAARKAIFASELYALQKSFTMSVHVQSRQSPAIEYRCCPDERGSDIPLLRATVTRDRRVDRLPCRSIALPFYRLSRSGVTKVYKGEVDNEGNRQQRATAYSRYRKRSGESIE